MLSQTNIYRRPYRAHRLVQEDKKFCCIVYVDEPSKYSVVESRRLIDIDEHGYGRIKELGKTYAVHIEQTDCPTHCNEANRRLLFSGTLKSIEGYGQLLEKALEARMHEDTPSDCEDWKLKSEKKKIKHSTATTISISKLPLKQKPSCQCRRSPFKLFYQPFLFYLAASHGEISLQNIVFG